MGKCIEYQVGDIIGELELVEYLGMEYPAENSKQKRSFGLFRCQCGEVFKAQITNVKNKNTRSCGCLKKK